MFAGRYGGHEAGLSERVSCVWLQESGVSHTHGVHGECVSWVCRVKLIMQAVCSDCEVLTVFTVCYIRVLGNIDRHGLKLALAKYTLLFSSVLMNSNNAQV